jgi:hypothetical protein
MNLLLRAIETSNFEERIAILEKRLVAAETVEREHGEQLPPQSD